MPRSAKIHLLLLLLCVFPAKAQYNIDSLKAVVANPRVHDTARLANILDIINNTDYEEGLRYVNLMGRIAQKNLSRKPLSDALKKSYTGYLASYYSNLTVFQQEAGDPKALQSINKLIALYQSVGDTDEVYAATVTKGILLYRDHQYQQAIDCYFAALKYFEANPQENLDNLWYVYLNLGTVYSEQDQYAESIRYLQRALYYFGRKGDGTTVEDQIHKSNIYMSIGCSYIAINRLDKAEENLKKSLLLARANKDDYRVALTLGRLGLIDMKRDRYPDAQKKFAEAIKTSDNPVSKSYALITLGKVYHHQKDDARAEKCLEQGIVLAKTLNWDEMIMDGAELLGPISKAKGNYKKAYEMLELYQKFNNSLRTAENKNRLKEQKLQYDFEKKELRYKLETEHKNAAKNNLLIGLVALVLLVFAIAYFYYRSAKQKQAISLLEKTELRQKLLLTQMNPHFIFNSIDNIQSLIYNKQEALAVNYLGKFSKLTRQILEHSEENYISLEEEITMLENYLSIQQLLYNGRFDFEVGTEQRLDPAAILLPPMLTQPFVENAIKHGLKNKTGKGKIKASFGFRNEKLYFEVTDNGAGFSAANASGPNKSLAIKLTRERLRGISGAGGFEVSFENITGTGGAVLGARVYFEIPYIYEK